MYHSCALIERIGARRSIRGSSRVLGTNSVPTFIWKPNSTPNNAINHAAMIQEAPLKIYARGVVSYFYFSRAPRARAENQANQQCHFKSSRCCMDPLGTDSCRGTVPMELPVPNSSMQHREPKSEIDDTGQILQGASCTIAADLLSKVLNLEKLCIFVLNLVYV